MRAGEAIVEAMAALVKGATPGVLLNNRISTSFGEIRERLIEQGHATLLASGEATGDGFSAPPSRLTIDAAEMTPEVTEEASGPLIAVAFYDEISDIEEGLRHIPKSLTATIHNDPSETELTDELARRVGDYAGRLVFNGYPPGVRVSWGQHHGGPWPATNSQHTSVGVNRHSSLPPTFRVAGRSRVGVSGRVARRPHRCSASGRRGVQSRFLTSGTADGIVRASRPGVFSVACASLAPKVHNDIPLLVARLLDHGRTRV